MGCLLSQGLNVHPIFPELPAGLGRDLGESRARGTVWKRQKMEAKYVQLPRTLIFEQRKTQVQPNDRQCLQCARTRVCAVLCHLSH